MSAIDEGMVALGRLTAGPADTSRPLDVERLRGLIEHGCTTHEDPEKVAEFLRQGAAFYARVRGDDLEVALKFTDEAPVIAAHRARVWGYDAEALAPENAGAMLAVVSAPLSTLRRVPQG